MHFYLLLPSSSSSSLHQKFGSGSSTKQFQFVLAVTSQCLVTSPVVPNKIKLTNWTHLERSTPVHSSARQLILQLVKPFSSALWAVCARCWHWNTHTQSLLLVTVKHYTIQINHILFASQVVALCCMKLLVIFMVASLLAHWLLQIDAGPGCVGLANYIAAEWCGFSGSLFVGSGSLLMLVHQKLPRDLTRSRCHLLGAVAVWLFTFPF